MFYSRKSEAVWSISCVSVACFPSLKHNFIAYRSSKVSSRLEIDQLWQSGFSRVYSNCCCSCSFEREIIKNGHSSHKMYSNNIVNFQQSMTILNAWIKKKSGNLLNSSRITFNTWCWHQGQWPSFKALEHPLKICYIEPLPAQHGHSGISVLIQVWIIITLFAVVCCCLLQCWVLQYIVTGPLHFFCRFLSMFFISLERGQNFDCVKERQMDANGHEDKLPYWPITYLLCGTLAKRDAQPLIGTFCDWLNPFRPLAESDRLKSNRISRGHLYISFDNAHHFRPTTWLLPFIYTCASCAEKFLIDGSVKGQYATIPLNYVY